MDDKIIKILTKILGSKRKLKDAQSRTFINRAARQVTRNRLQNSEIETIKKELANLKNGNLKRALINKDRDLQLIKNKSATGIIKALKGGKLNALRKNNYTFNQAYMKNKKRFSNLKNVSKARAKELAYKHTKYQLNLSKLKKEQLKKLKADGLINTVLDSEKAFYVINKYKSGKTLTREEMVEYNARITSLESATNKVNITRMRELVGAK